MSDFVMTEEVRTILTGMKEHLSRGWTTGTMVDANDNVCLYGALLKTKPLPYVSGMDPDSLVNGRGNPDEQGASYLDLKEPEGIAVLMLAEEAGCEWADLALWNDNSTQADVVGLIDRVLLKHPVETEATVAV